MRTSYRPLILAALLAVAMAPLPAQDSAPPPSEPQVTVTVPAGDSAVVGPSTTPTTVVASPDTTPVDTATIVWPQHFTLKNFVVGNQMLVSTALVALLLFLFSQWEKFSELKDGITRAVQFVVGSVISYLIVSWGGTPDPGIAALTTGFISMIAGGMIFKMGRTQPGNTR